MGSIQQGMVIHAPSPFPPVRKVGAAGVTVSTMGLGGAPLANFFRPIPEAEIAQLIDYCVEKGISFFDTAPQYGCGLSEQRLGRALQTVPRPRFTLATKVGYMIQGQKRLRKSYSRDSILRSLEESLKRLGLGRIDVVHIHDPDKHYREALEVAFPTLAELRSQGVIGAIGAGMNQWQMPLKFAFHADFDCFLVAGRYTLLKQDSLPLLDFCQQKGIAIFLGGVYNTGILATGAVEGARYNYHLATPAILARVRQIEAVCQRHNIALRAAALQFAAAHPAVASLVIGMECAGEVDDALEALHRPIPADLWQELRAERLLDERAPVPPHQP